jgi:hypothetical protein
MNYWLYELLDIFPVALDTEVPVHPKQEKVPHVPDWQLHRWIIFHACIPLAIHHAYTLATGRNLGPIAAFIFYSFMLKLIAIRQIRMLRDLGHTHGFLDGAVSSEKKKRISLHPPTCKFVTQVLLISSLQLPLTPKHGLIPPSTSTFCHIATVIQIPIKTIT